jgi:prepilin-type N-terminal cleavage/methylation domain-containing protein
MRKYLGLTLIELLITLAIIGIVALIGAPSMSGLQKRIQLKGAVQTSYFAFQHARSGAIAKGVELTIVINSGNKWCLALSDSGICDCELVNHCTVDGVEHLVAGKDYGLISLQEVKFGKESRAVFDPIRGLAVGHAGSVIFSDGTQQLKLILSNMGRVRICAVGSEIGGYQRC